MVVKIHVAGPNTTTASLLLDQQHMHTSAMPLSPAFTDFRFFGSDIIADYGFQIFGLF
jgi:hypothetical protein